MTEARAPVPTPLLRPEFGGWLGNVCVCECEYHVCVWRWWKWGPQSIPLAGSSWMEKRGCGFRGDESEVSISHTGERPKPLLPSSRFAPPPVSQCWASWERRRRCWSGCWVVVPSNERRQIYQNWTLNRFIIINTYRSHWMWGWSPQERV